MILLIDNNDSFTYNIINLLSQISTEGVDIINSAEINIDKLNNYSHIIISPGPSLPKDYPLLFEVLNSYIGKIPILGICLGFQTICTYLGSELLNYSEPLHGVETEIDCDCNSVLFNDYDKMLVGRYHSWYINKVSEQLKVTATDNNIAVMAVENAELGIYGVQFHPESYITKNGAIILNNFLNAKIK